MKGTLLIVDDKKKIFESLNVNFFEAGYNVEYASNRSETVNAILTKKIGTVLLDIMLGEESGIDVLKDIQSLNSAIPVIMITGYASVDTAVQAMKLGAFDYVKKPLDFDRLLKIVDNAISLYTLKEENITLKSRLCEQIPQIYTNSPVVKKLVERVLKIAPTDLPVLITGENGTGKEVIADYLHINSSRAAKSIKKINCAAFPESLLDNELFGHEKGSYTGADSRYKGIFEHADGGTLFLDEIGDMPQTIQAKILRTLQNREIRRIGGNETIQVDVRFIAATNKNIEELIEKNLFRQDLYYRLNAATISMPPLRERKEDIPLLVDRFISDYVKDNGMGIKSVDESVLSVFLEYSWPGNIRELKNAINYACAIAVTDRITIEDLPPNFTGKNPVSEHGNIREEMERALIARLLKTHYNNKSKVAQVLKMSRNTLYQKLQKYGIE